MILNENSVFVSLSIFIQGFNICQNLFSYHDFSIKKLNFGLIILWFSVEKNSVQFDILI